MKLLLRLCHICHKPLGTDRVRDHDHLKQCLQSQIQKSLLHPCHFHNLRGYDRHLIMSGISESQPSRISCIPNNMEKYISFSIGSLRFIDSLQFLNSSLDKLVANLAKQGIGKFSYLSQHFPDPIHLQLLMRKGVHCYSFMDNFNKFNYPSLPDKEHSDR